MSAESDPPPARRRPIFVIFEGGGAKGVAHVGALDAIAENELEIIGVAGTSAGALAAVLAAIGLDAADIMHPQIPEENILARHGYTPTTLLGQAHWDQYQELRRIPSDVFGGGVIEGVLEAAYAVPMLISVVGSAVRRRGHFKTATIQAFINQIIRERLTQIREEGGLDLAIPQEVTFGDLSESWPTVLPLKIIVTDISRGRLEVLDRHRTPQVKVAEAVAASIAIPFVFEPARIPSFRDGLFADGGLVSNLPIWAFAEEKLAYEREHFAEPPIPIIGFSLQAPQQSASPGSILHYAWRLVETALAGSQGTAHRFLEDLTIVPLQTHLGLLDFGARWSTLKQARDDGQECANRELRFSLDVRPDRIRAELRAIREDTLGLINRRRRRLVTHLRANLIRPYGDLSLRVVEGVNMSGDADDRLLLDRRGRGAAQAYRERGLRIFKLGGMDDDPPHEFMTKYERALLRPSVRAVVCVPIFEDVSAWQRDEADRPEPSGVLSIDSDEPLATAFNDPDLLNMLVDKSAVLFAAISLEPTHG
jgi:predicted acylesterase/phospholipase RssA